MAGMIHDNAKQSFFQKSSTPESRLIPPFLQAGFDVSWANKIVSHRSHLLFCLLEPDNTLKESYGFEYEVVLVYSPYDTLEPRTFQAVDRFMSSTPAKGRAESMFFFLVSKANHLEEWITAYLLEHKEERIAIPLAFSDLVAGDASGWTIRNAIQRHYLTLDRFKYSLPLQEDTYFFGRQYEIVRLLDTAKRGENAGCSGYEKRERLRSFSKSSVLSSARICQSNFSTPN